MSKLVSFLKSLYDPPEYRCLILGLDGSGKTTLLYRLKLGEVVTTIPTIGFNCEEVRWGQDVVTFWDVGGCDKMRPLIRHYMTPGHSILFLVNTSECISDQGRLQDTLKELKGQVVEALKHGLVFVGIAFTKQDLVDASQRIEEGIVWQCVLDTMESVFPADEESRYSLFGIGVSSITGHGLDLMMKQLVAGIKQNCKTKPGRPDRVDPADIAGATSAEGKGHTGDLYAGVTPERFFEMMESGNLPQWDHRAHVRGGFYVLTKCLESGSGLWDAVDEFLVMLDKMLATDAARAQIEGTERRFRNTVHRTMTTFFLHTIHMGILKFMDFRNPPRIPQHTEFEAFIMTNSHLLRPRLWAEYYTRELLFSPSAKVAWRLPDIKPLPIYFRSAGNSLAATRLSLVPGSPTKESKDWIKRFAFATLKRAKSTGERRGKVVQEALQALQRHTIYLRARGHAIEAYSETKAYFWIQIMHAAFQGLGPRVDITRLSFDSLVLIFPDLARDNAWREYYKPSLWDSVRARTEFVPPLSRPLPNFIPPVNPAAGVAREVRLKAIGPARSTSEVELMLCEHWAIADMQDPSAMLRSHGGLLWWYFSALWTIKRIPDMPIGGAARALIKDDLLRNDESSRGITEKTFWIQVILTRLERFPVTKGKDSSLWDRRSCLVDARRFLSENRDLAGEDLWMEFYSPETWRSADAFEVFLPPDIKPLGGFLAVGESRGSGVV